MDHVQNHKLDTLSNFSLPVHPTQLYSFGANLLICFLLIAMTAKIKIKGQLFSLYLMVYGVWRITIEFLRDDQDRHLGLSVAQYIAIGQIVIGLALWVYFQKTFKKEYPVDDGEVKSAN